MSEAATCTLLVRIWVKTRYTQSVREPSPIRLAGNSVGSGSTLWSHPDTIRLDLRRRSSPERHRRGRAEISHRYGLTRPLSIFDGLETAAWVRSGAGIS